MKLPGTIAILVIVNYLLTSFLPKSLPKNAGISRNDTIIIKDYGNQTVSTSYEHGKRNGKEIVIFKNGDTSIIRDYKNDLLDGLTITFYPHNKIGSMGTYEEGFRVGSFKNFDTSGNLQVETFFDGKSRFDDNLWSGRQIFYERGTIIFTQFWEHGRRTNIVISDQKLYSEYKTHNMAPGYKLFDETCAQCHSLKIQIVGPSLSGIGQIRNRDWPMQFVRNGDSLMKGGDSLAGNVYRKYGKVAHPDFSYLTRKDIEAILDYIKEH